MVAVFRAVRRVMRDDAVCWLNIGDSYAGSWGNYAPGGIKGEQRQQTEEGQRWDRPAYSDTTWRPPTASVAGLKPKDLCLIPARLALALQADGWWVRSDPPWLKGNPMPESCTDRPSKGHEYIWLLAKSQRVFYDNEAVKVPAAQSTIERLLQPTLHMQAGSDRVPGKTNGPMKAVGSTNGRNRRTTDWWDYDALIDNLKAYIAHVERIRDDGGMMLDMDGDPVAFQINPTGFPGAHFATFPPALVEPMIQAGTSERGVCPECGSQWERVVAKEYGEDHSSTNHIAGGDKTIGVGWEGTQRRATVTTETLGFRPTCTCPEAEPVPATVLDPFGGAGTVGLVADRLGRDAVLIELSASYAEMARQRIAADAPMFARVEMVLTPIESGSILSDVKTGKR